VRIIPNQPPFQLFHCETFEANFKGVGTRVFRRLAHTCLEVQMLTANRAAMSAPPSYRAILLSFPVITLGIFLMIWAIGQGLLDDGRSRYSGGFFGSGELLDSQHVRGTFATKN
jgi:hypothetical protein